MQCGEHGKVHAATAFWMRAEPFKMSMTHARVRHHARYDATVMIPELVNLHVPHVSLSGQNVRRGTASVTGV